ncbi:hypothetical protein RDABS01_023656 [Bienertia sinuspersici]
MEVRDGPDSYDGVSVDVRKRGNLCIEDRLTTLPVELLISILSLVPTKDAAAACVSCKRMIRVFPWITTVDLDDSCICHCVLQPYRRELFPTFVAFVDTVVQAVSHQSHNLTKFRLGVGPRWNCPIGYNPKHVDEVCEASCFPDLKSAQINAWVSFPLTCCGIKELDLRIRVREAVGDVHDPPQLPPEIFKCATLEVLKLSVNLGLDQVSAMPSFGVPNLKILFLAANFPKDDLLTRLVSSCPLLEDLTVKSTWNHARFVSISSPSLRKLCLYVSEKIHENIYSDFVLIDTPYLEYLEYASSLASHYSVTNMAYLVKARIMLDPNESLSEVSSLVTLNLLRSLSNVQHLVLRGSYLEDLNHDELKDQLPTFPNLKFLELGYDGFSYWDKVVLAFLSCSPLLETLVFPMEMTAYCSNEDEQLVLERQFFRATLPVIPSCCRCHLKRIEMRNFHGSEREMDMLQFFLRHALVLEELVIFWRSHIKKAVVDKMKLQSTLQNFPRASVTCSIKVFSAIKTGGINSLPHF